MTEWSQPDQAERFVREYADPILRVCAAYSLGRSWSGVSKVRVSSSRVRKISWQMSWASERPRE